MNKQKPPYRTTKGAPFIVVGMSLISFNPLDVGMCALGLAIVALGMMIVNNKRVAVFRQGTAMGLAAMAGTIIPALVTDIEYYGPIGGLSAFLLIGIAYRVCKPLGMTNE